MVTIPIPEQSARKILSIFVAAGCGPGDTAEMNYFIEAWAARKLNDGYFMPGMEFARATLAIVLFVEYVITASPVKFEQYSPSRRYNVVVRGRGVFHGCILECSFVGRP